VSEDASVIQEKLTRYIEREIAYDREQSTVGPDEPLLNGIIDSTDILRLVAYLDEEMGVEMDDEDLVPENFETIRKLATYVASKTGAR
jgi:acyl carrier protein